MKIGTDTYIQWKKEHYDQFVIKTGRVVTFAITQLEKIPRLTVSPSFPTESLHSQDPSPSLPPPNLVLKITASQWPLTIVPAFVTAEKLIHRSQWLLTPRCNNILFLFKVHTFLETIQSCLEWIPIKKSSTFFSYKQEIIIASASVVISSKPVRLSGWNGFIPCSNLRSVFRQTLELILTAPFNNRNESLTMICCENSM